MATTRRVTTGWLGVLAMAAILCPRADAQTTWDNGGGDYLWTNPVNWIGDALPTGSTEVRINADCSPSQPVVLTGVGDALRINLGVASSEAGYLDIVNGWLTNTTTTLECNIGNDGVGEVRLASGVLYCARTLNVGYGGSGQGTLRVQGGEVRTVDSFYAGRNGTGTVVQTGGTITPNFNSQIYIGAVAGSFGSVIVSNGMFGTSALGYNVYVGGGGKGELYIRGGTVTMSRNMYIGNASTSTGYLMVESGALAVTRELYVGSAGRGTLIVGSPSTCRSLYIGEGATGQGEVQVLQGASLTLGANYDTTVGNAGSGLLVMHGGTISAGSNTGDIIVRNSAGRGAMQGWGTYAANRQILNNGLIIADGEGVERDLNLSSLDGYQSVAAWTNTIENVTTNGWYARNQGRLLLCPQTIPVGAGQVLNWAESIGDTEIDLVNSLRFTFASVTTQGALSVALLAADRSDVPAAPSGKALIGVWKATFAGAFTTVDLECRYDQTATDGAPVSLMRWNATSSQWELLGSSPLSGHRVTAAGVAPLGAEKIGLFAAVVAAGPTPTVITIR